MTRKEKIQELEKELQKLKDEDSQSKLQILFKNGTTVIMKYGSYTVRNAYDTWDTFLWFQYNQKVDAVLEDAETSALYNALLDIQKKEDMDILFSNEFLTLVSCYNSYMVRYWNIPKKKAYWDEFLIAGNAHGHNRVGRERMQEYEQKYKRITE